MTDRDLRPVMTGLFDRTGIPARLRDFIEHLRTPLYRNAYALVINSAVSSALGLLYWVLVARLYSAEDVGRSSAMISSLTFLSGIAQLNLRPVMSRFIPVAGARTGPFVAWAYVVTAVVSLVVGGVFVLGIGLWASGDVFGTIQRSPLLGLGFVLLTALWCIFSLQDGVLIGLRRSVSVLVENSLFGVAKILLAVVFTLAVATRGLGVLASWVVPMLVAVIGVNAFVFRRYISEHVMARPESDGLMDARGMARYVAGDYLGSLFAVAYASLLPVIVINGLGAAKSAHFYIVWVIFTSLQLVPVQMVTSLVVETASDANAFHRHARHVVVQVARILVPTGLILIFGGSFILEVFGRGYAQDGTDLLRLLVISLVPWTIINVFFGHARVLARVRGIVGVQALLAAGILGLSIVLLPVFGLAGVGIANLVTQSVLAIFLAVTSLRPVFRGGQPSAAV